jgi:hypothetical protein
MRENSWHDERNERNVSTVSWSGDTYIILDYLVVFEDQRPSAPKS